MSSRVTRAAAKKQADSSTSNPADPPAPQTEIPKAARTPRTATPSRKRKAPASLPTSPRSSPLRKPSKRSKRTEAKVDERADAGTGSVKRTAMSSAGAPPGGSKVSETPAPAVSSSSSSKKKTGKAKKTSPDQAAAGSAVPNKRVRPKKNAPSEEPPLKADDASESNELSSARSPPEDNSGDELSENEEDPYDYDPFSAAGGGLLPPSQGGMFGMPSTAALRALSGAMSGMAGTSTKMQSLLENLKQKDDPDTQLVALGEMSELLLVSTEDNLAGHFQPDIYVKEFITLMQTPEHGMENPDMMLMACRCIANLIEALPAATATVVYCGAVPVLVSKLTVIDYMDLAEQALVTLKKTSDELPASIVREGGLTACLQFLDFFPTGTQRTAVTTAANCCRNVPEDSFDVVKKVMPDLQNVLNGSDQVVVEQGCLCISRIVESFRREHQKLEELMTPEILQAILRLLLPGTTNLVSAKIHTSFLRVLSITARASPTLSGALLKMNIVDTLYQFLTGVSPPSDDDHAAQKIDSVVIMQALIHRPREQVFETLNVICELLPDLAPEDLGYLNDAREAHQALLSHTDRVESAMKNSALEERKRLMKDCKPQLKRFAVILLPTLTDAYSSTVNINVREKVLSAQLKMLSTLDAPLLEDALRTVPYASFLASIFSQQDHPLLTAAALQAARLLLQRLEPIYRYQFYREGVIAEIKKLADRPPTAVAPQTSTPAQETPNAGGSGSQGTEPATRTAQVSVDVQDDSGNEDEDEDEDGDDEEVADEMGYVHDADSGPDSDSSDEPVSPTAIVQSTNIQDQLSEFARDFLKRSETNDGKSIRDKAAKILKDLQALVADIADCYEKGSSHDGAKLFGKLARYFDGDAIESITSYELLTSKAVSTLLELFDDPNVYDNDDARSAFIEAFMGSSTQSKVKTASSESPATPFSVLIHKLQDLLSRSEHFEVLTVHQGTADRGRASETSMLAKQIRIRLQEDHGETAVPSVFQGITLSIHAIATFKSLDDYLRPRIALSEKSAKVRGQASSSDSNAARPSLLAGLETSEGIQSRSTPAKAPMPRSAMKTPDSRPSTRNSSKAKVVVESEDSPSGETGKSRSANRKVKTDTKPTKPAASPPQTNSTPIDEALQAALECADENQLSDDEEMEGTDALGSLVDEFEEELNDEAAEPTAVNMEVGNTGKVVAREDDGTRISTPQAASTTRPVSSRPAFSSGLAQSLYMSSTRPMSYSAAVQAPPTDWHLQFTVNGHRISSDTTIYRAVHSSFVDTESQANFNTWSGVHTINFRRVPGPAPAENTSTTSRSNSQASASGLPQSLDKNPTTAAILRLLRVLHEMNANIEDVLNNDRSTVKVTPEPLAQFVNTKLTAKMNRQLEEPLIVASNCLPRWSEDLAILYPFLFPFETRHLFLQSTSFGYSRSMARWQNAQSTNESRHGRYRDERQFFGRLARQKVRISRNRILESATKVMDLYGASSSILEVEYFEEVGTGLGPTLEFYSVVSKEMCKKKLRFWRENESAENDEFVFAKHGLFPAPMTEQLASTANGKRVLELFAILGKFVARSMLDSRMIDLPFNPTFFRINTGANAIKPSLGAVKTVDEGLARSLHMLKQFAVAKKKIMSQDRLNGTQKAHKISGIQVGNASIDDLGLDFTLPGYPSIELCKDGANTPLTIDNVGSYVEKVIDYTLGSGVERQVEAFRKGFSQVFPYKSLSAFTPDELVMLFGRVDEDWSMETLMDCIKADHGYTLDSKSVRNLLQTMSELSASSRREFLQFVTGSPKLPIGGFRSLTPMFTVVLRPSEPGHVPDEYLPSCMTCVNYLKLPDYSSFEVMRAKLGVAIKEGQGAFHLS
ncbi:MAG: Ubiquitin fusion degradation protein 4 [Chrysothrix sp. TS-e1954]|nr:MAG: Ubiquitin fusion degradation protein 4 [Chrysothrix sp. TS-e1954]